MKRARKGREYRRLLINLRAIARSEERDWDEPAWRRAVARATAAEPGAARPARSPRLRWAWAYAAVLVILLGAGAVVTLTVVPRPGMESAGEAGAGGAARAGLEGGSADRMGQNQLSLTLVSGESGLRVHWYFNREFDWKEEQ
jgi:ferric-dicitrate binding protein FerR (iron transport regulator)